MRKVRTIEMKRLTVEEYREAEKLPLVVVLDDVRSMYNIGSVFRTCIFVAFVRHLHLQKSTRRPLVQRRVSAGVTSIQH